MKIQSVYKVIGDYGCLALNYLWVAGIPYEKLAEKFNDLLSAKIIDGECTIQDATKFYAAFGVTATVAKTSTAPVDGSKYIARFVRGNFGHFVGMQGGKVVNNTLDFSFCVSDGKLDPETPFRIITIKK